MKWHYLSRQAHFVGRIHDFLIDLSISISYCIFVVKAMTMLQSQYLYELNSSFPRNLTIIIEFDHLISQKIIDHLSLQTLA